MPPKHAWDDWEASGDDEGDQLEREWGARREDFFNSGYREGLEAGKHGTVQQGFNAGYAAGAEAGYAWGAACGGAASLAAFQSKLPPAAPGLDRAALQSVVSCPFKHAAEAAVDHVMKEHTAGATQQPAGSGGGGGGTEAGVALGSELTYQDLQGRQQRIVELLQDQGLHLDLRRKQAASNHLTPS